MQRVLRHARLAAASDATVLLMGENGTGKELIARAVHEHSNRRDRPFIPVNCAAIPESLIESELFGHEKGAFTGATELARGGSKSPNEGTIFLDEVGELDLNMQVKLLRFLQEREINRVGGMRASTSTSASSPQPTAIWTTCSKRARSDRTSTSASTSCPIQIPPLRERREDIPLLVDYFLKKYAKGSIPRESLIKDEDLGIMMEYAWPGNIRELENVIERALVLGTQVTAILQGIARGRRGPDPAGRGRWADASMDGGRPLASAGDDGSEPGAWEPLPIRELEKRHILRTLRHTRGNRTEAARLLGINPSTLWRKMKTYDISEAGHDSG
jgi:DNA-binding NtrC family response regulator